MATPKKRWSQRVTDTSDALTLDKGVFTRGNPRSIAMSLKRSAERSHKRKSNSYRSAMSMLSFYVNRAGKTLPATSRRRIEAAKEELRVLYGKSSTKTARGKSAKRKTTKRRSPTAKKKTRSTRTARTRQRSARKRRA